MDTSLIGTRVPSFQPLKLLARPPRSSLSRSIYPFLLALLPWVAPLPAPAPEGPVSTVSGSGTSACLSRRPTCVQSSHSQCAQRLQIDEPVVQVPQRQQTNMLLMGRGSWLGGCHIGACCVTGMVVWSKLRCLRDVFCLGREEEGRRSGLESHGSRDDGCKNREEREETVIY